MDFESDSFYRRKSNAWMVSEFQGDDFAPFDLPATIKSRTRRFLSNCYETNEEKSRPDVAWKLFGTVRDIRVRCRGNPNRAGRTGNWNYLTKA
jgi:hypothetical protein